MLTNPTKKVHNPFPVMVMVSLFHVNDELLHGPTSSFKEPLYLFIFCTTHFKPLTWSFIPSTWVSTSATTFPALPRDLLSDSSILFRFLIVFSAIDFSFLDFSFSYFNLFSFEGSHLPRPTSFATHRWHSSIYLWNILPVMTPFYKRRKSRKVCTR